MTLPFERKAAVNNTRRFLRDLMDPQKTPRISLAIRREARWLLKHYPGERDMQRAAAQSDVFAGEFSEPSVVVSG